MKHKVLCMLVMGWLALWVGLGEGGAVLAAGEAWRSLGPEGGRIQAVAVDPWTPTTLYAGTYPGGVFKSTDGGAHWFRCNAGLTETRVLALALDPQTPTTLYAGTDGRGVFQSTDGGLSWRSISAGLTNRSVYALAIDPQAATTLYAGTYGGVFKSTDGGARWSTTNLGYPYVEALALAPQPPATLYAGTWGGGVFKLESGWHGLFLPLIRRVR
jgi:ligand-binding sensor domain-containing protein